MPAISYQDIIKKIEPEMDKALTFFRQELTKIRTARVSPALLDGIEVELLGQRYPLKQLALIAVNSPRELVIQPWDPSYVQAIEQAILKAGISGQPAADRQIVRVNFPALSQDYRQELISKVHQLAETVRQSIRHWREKAWHEVQLKTRAGAIREDDKFRAKDKLQEMVDSYQEKIEEMVGNKEKEILG